MERDSKKQNNKDEERTKKELDYISMIKEIDSNFKQIKAKREYLIYYLYKFYYNKIAHLLISDITSHIIFFERKITLDGTNILINNIFYLFYIQM